jgi:hypothetical protein
MLAAAGVMTAGALIGGTGAGEASAASATNLCNTAGYCLGYSASGGVSSTSVLGIIPTPATEWLYPNYVGDHASISVDGQNVCLQIYGTIAAGSKYLVRGAACVGDTADQWVNTYDSAAHRTEFISVWAQDQGFGNLCLASSSGFLSGSLSIGTIYVSPCGDDNASQDWGTSI